MTEYKGTKGGAVQNFEEDPGNPYVGQVWYNETTANLRVRHTTLTSAWASGGNLPAVKNSSGGAVSDFNLRISIINEFITDFKFAFFNYNTLGDRHSPVLPIIISIIHKLGFELSEIRFLHIHLLPLIIFFSYKCLVIKFSIKGI